MHIYQCIEVKSKTNRILNMLTENCIKLCLSFFFNSTFCKVFPNVLLSGGIPAGNVCNFLVMLCNFVIAWAKLSTHAFRFLQAFHSFSGIHYMSIPLYIVKPRVNARWPLQCRGLYWRRNVLISVWILF